MSMTVGQMRIRAKIHGLTGYSRMRKAELVALLDSIRHNVGDVVERAFDRKRGVVVEVQNSTFEGVSDSTVIIQYDGEKREDATCGAHHAFVFVSRSAEPRKCAEPVKPARKMDRYGHWAMSFPLAKGGDGNVCQGHADYCAEYGHATEKSTDLNGVTTVAGHCPRCGATLKTAEQVISERDMVDQAQMIEVMTQVVANGREDLAPVLDMIDATECQVPDGRDSSIPRVHFCPRCADSVNPCDQCVLAWLVALFNITGEVALAELPAVAEFDCYA